MLAGNGESALQKIINRQGPGFEGIAVKRGEVPLPGSETLRNVPRNGRDLHTRGGSMHVHALPTSDDQMAPFGASYSDNRV